MYEMVQGDVMQPPLATGLGGADEDLVEIEIERLEDNNRGHRSSKRAY